MNQAVLDALIDGVERWQFEGLTKTRLIKSGVPALGLDSIGQFAAMGDLARWKDTYCLLVIANKINQIFTHLIITASFNPQAKKRINARV